ncbi:glycosyltransferase family 2 protein [Lutispora sp.]|uniref:glycosyltransferase family 2 protein n=1 Tax=Lutispora sp. TaxID=2828727 RepID=UPI0035652B08
MAETNIKVNKKTYTNSDYLLKGQHIVSVIIATYHREHTLEKALLSLARQTYKQLEIIVVDDNADSIWSKKVDDIVCRIKLGFQTQIVLIKNEMNKGSAETRNIGIRAASGEYITFLDDDDVYLPDKVKNQLEHMLEEDSDYSLTDLYLYDENGKLLEIRTRKYIKENSKEDLLRYHFMHHMTGTDTMMFKRDYLLSIGGFPPINVGDEFYLMQKAIEGGGKFSYLPVCDIKAYVHTHTDGLSSGESKINGENELYRHKKKFFHLFGNKDTRYMQMRHYAVLAFAKYRGGYLIEFIKYSLYSFFSSPFQSINLILNRKIK